MAEKVQDTDEGLMRIEDEATHVQGSLANTLNMKLLSTKEAPGGALTQIKDAI